MQLLVSVRSHDEALSALAGGADIVDAKEPLSGALGQVSQPTFAEIVDVVASRAPVTAAGGDAADEADVEMLACTFARAGASFVKVGFAGVDREERVTTLVASAVKGAGVAMASLVAVAYADYGQAGSLPPDTIAAAAARAGARGVLLDTAAKTGCGLFQWMTAETLAAWVGRVHAAGMFAAVAGQLGAAQLDLVRRCGADIIGVRGAVCEGGRSGAVSAEKVRELRAALRGRAHCRQPTEGQAAVPAQSTDRRSPPSVRRRA